MHKAQREIDIFLISAIYMRYAVAVEIDFDFVLQAGKRQAA